jgi:hypothetical protein
MLSPMLTHTCKLNPLSRMICPTMKPSPSIFDIIPSKPSTTYGINNQLNAYVATLGVMIMDMTFGTVSSLGHASSVRNMVILSCSAIGHIPYATPTDATASTQTTITTIAWPALVTTTLWLRMLTGG